MNYHTECNNIINGAVNLLFYKRTNYIRFITVKIQFSVFILLFIIFTISFSGTIVFLKIPDLRLILGLFIHLTKKPGFWVLLQISALLNGITGKENCTTEDHIILPALTSLPMMKAISMLKRQLIRLLTVLKQLLNPLQTAIAHF